MSYDFNINDIIDMAIQIERNGAEFYKKAAEGLSDPDHKKLLMDFSKMEVEHERTFASFKNELSPQEKAPTTFDPDNQAALYIKALTDTKVFFEKEIDTTSFKGILKAAMAAEKDSILFYLGMQDLVPAKLGKGKIDNIIKEEMGHIRIIGKLLVSLT